MGQFKLLLQIGVISSLFTMGLSCGKEKKVSKVSAKVRSTGPSSLNLELQETLMKRAGLPLGDPTLLASSIVTIESYRVPVSRINLIVLPKDGGGYSETSPPFYACPYSADADCLIDLAQPISIDNLLQGATTTEVSVSESKSYDGVAVEFCHEFNNANAGSIEASHFEARLKASMQLGETKYYTNKSTGLSATGPSEEIAITVKGTGCGVQSPLLEPVTLKEGEATDIVLYADPNGAVFATNNIPAANSNCQGSDDLAVCTDAVAIFGTVDTSAPTIERYHLVTAAEKADVLMTVILNSAGQPFGAMLRHLYTNTETEKTLHASLNINQIEVNADDSLTCKGRDESGSLFNIITNFQRGVHSGTIEKFVTLPVSYTASKL